MNVQDMIDKLNTISNKQRVVLIKGQTDPKEYWDGEIIIPHNVPFVIIVGSGETEGK